MSRQKRVRVRGRTDVLIAEPACCKCLDIGTRDLPAYRVPDEALIVTAPNAPLWSSSSKRRRELAILIRSRMIGFENGPAESRPTVAVRAATASDSNVNRDGPEPASFERNAAGCYGCLRKSCRPGAQRKPRDEFVQPKVVYATPDRGETLSSNSCSFGSAEFRRSAWAKHTPEHSATLRSSQAVHYWQRGTDTSFGLIIVHSQTNCFSRRVPSSPPASTTAKRRGIEAG